jgi:hypothetical protein
MVGLAKIQVRIQLYSKRDEQLDSDFVKELSWGPSVYAKQFGAVQSIAQELKGEPIEAMAARSDH